jgi:hypothetical protein
MHELLIMGPAAWKGSLDRFAGYKCDTAVPASVMTIEEAQWILRRLQLGE